MHPNHPDCADRPAARAFGDSKLRRLTLALVALGPLLAGCRGHTVQIEGSSTRILPLRSVRLYETGVGYFERAGGIGARDTSLPVPASHVDDALKTLVVLSQDARTRVYGLEFASLVSRGMGRALAGLPQGSEDALSFRALLTTLKGTSIEVRAPEGSLSGRLIDVLPAPPPEASPNKDGKDVKEGPAPHGDELVLLMLSESGELHRVSTARLLAVRPLDPSFAPRLRTALDATSQRGAQSQRLLRLLSRDGGPVTLGYVAETPLWRVTYRLVIGPTGKAGVLQGWALVHNDTDEDWGKVRVHLVSGRPDSFVFPLAAPRYNRRELITPDNRLSTVPQLLGQTADAMWGDHIEDAESVGGLGLSGIGVGGGGTGEGTIGLGRISTVGHGSGVGGGGTGSSSLLSVGNLAAVAQSTGVEAGALFTYSLTEPLDLRAHGSALIPFVQEAVEVEAITWLDGPGATARSGARLSNSTRQTLPAGTLAVFDVGGLAGETALERLKPGERRFLQYGVDLDVELSKLREQSREEAQRLTFDHDTFEEHFLRRRDVLYRVENRAGQPRTLYVQLGLSQNAQIQGADRLEYDTTKSTPIAIFEVPPQSRLERPVSTVEGLVTRTGYQSLSAARLQQLATVATLPAAERAVVTEAVARQKELEDAAKELDRSRAEIKKTEKDLERLREHLKALGGAKDSSGPEGGNPLVRRILEGEDKLSALSKKLDTLEGDQERRREAVKKVLERLPKRADKR